MKCTILVGGSGRWQEYPEARFGGYLRRDVRRGDAEYGTAVNGHFSMRQIVAAIHESKRIGEPAPGLGGGVIVEVEL